MLKSGRYRKSDKSQWLQNPDQISGDNPKNVKCGTNETFKKTRKNV